MKKFPLGKMQKNLKGKGEIRILTAQKNISRKMDEILNDDHISESEAIYLREIFEEYQQDAMREFNGLLESYGIYEETPPIKRPRIGKRTRFLLIVGAPILLFIGRLFI